MSIDFESLRDPADDLLDRALRAMRTEPVPQAIRDRLIDQAARWKDVDLPRLWEEAGRCWSSALSIPEHEDDGGPDQVGLFSKPSLQGWLMIGAAVAICLAAFAGLKWLLIDSVAPPVKPQRIAPHVAAQDGVAAAVIEEQTDNRRQRGDGRRTLDSTASESRPLETADEELVVTDNSVRRTSTPMRVEFDLPYAETDNPRQRLDIYRPDQPAADGPIPVVVVIQGTFQVDDKRFGRHFANALVANGNYAVVAVGYRFSHEARWPAQIHDCKSAIRWIRANAARYQFDPNRIGVLGASAGAHLAAMLGTTDRSDGLEGTEAPSNDLSSRVNCVVDLFGATDLLTLGGHHDEAGSPESLLIGGPLQELAERARQASPTTYVTADDPPFLIIHGTHDRVIPFAQAETLTATLREAGVPVVLIPVEGGGHGNFRNPEVIRRIRAFFDQQLRSQTEEVSVEPISAKPTE